MKKLLFAFVLFIAFDSSSTIIPFTRAGNLILIKAKVDSVEGDFILDTGSPKLILNITYFRDYNSIGDRSEANESGGITGISEDEGPVMIPEFSIGPFKYYHLEVDRINLGHIEDVKGVKILGLLGVQLFSRFEIIIDYERNILNLHRISKKEGVFYKSEILNDTTAYNTFDLTFSGDKIMTCLKVAGKKLTFIIDTGAEANILDSRLPDKVFENLTIIRKITIAGTDSNRIEAVYGDMRNMKIGKRNINYFPVLVTNLEKMCRSYDHCLDGMLGFDFLSLHKIGFNFLTRKMFIWK